MSADDLEAQKITAMVSQYLAEITTSSEPQVVAMAMTLAGASALKGILGVDKGIEIMKGLISASKK